jgi:predicted choloylglycine hydrolase
MKKKIVGIFVVMLLIIGAIPAMGIFVEQKTGSNHDFFNGGWIEEFDNFKILHVNGSNYEMGYQQGVLLSDDIGENYRAFLNFTETFFDLDYEFYDWYWNELKENVPQEYKDELQGIADGSGIPLINISILNIMADYYHCCAAAAWGPATSDGKVIHVRSFDWTANMIDPITGAHIRENQIIMVRNPDVGFSSLEPTFSGLIGGPGGINENGVACGILVSYSWDENNRTHAEGNPVIFRIKEVLDHSSNAEEAVDIITSSETSGWNYMISDKEIGYAVEQNLHQSYYGTWDDPVEDTSPFWSIENVVRRTNIYINPDLAATQRRFYNPSIFPLISMILKLNPCAYVKGFSASVPYMHYSALSKGLEKLWGDIEIENTMDMLRSLYLGRTDFRFFLVKKLGGVYVALHQWVACPETGDIAISFSSLEKNAYENPVHHFNLYDLLNASPP